MDLEPSHRRRIAVIGLAAAALTLAGCGGKSANPSHNSAAPLPSSTSPSTSASITGSLPAVPVPTIAFSDCTSQVQSELHGSRATDMQVSCGRVSVPLDYAHPSGQHIPLFVVREHLRTQKTNDRIGSLLVNPGGPGASGVDLAIGLVNQLSDSVFDHFDVVGFDPRGVGLSSPVSCITDAQKDTLAALDPDVRTAAGQQTARTADAGVEKSCATKYGAALAHINTEETARDMDLLRGAVGDSKLNYLGFSYGTRLGAVYAHEYPTHIRAAVLDGAVDPAADELTTDERQAKGFEDAFDQFAADCMKRPACSVLGNPRQVVEKLIPAADAAPIRSSKAGEKRTATGGIVTTAVASALYSATDWPALGDALIAATKGDSAQLFTLADSYNERDASGHYTNLMDANLTINCNDSALTVTDQLVQAKAVDWTTKYPIFGPSAAAALYACQSWPKSGHSLPPATAPGAPPILVVGTVHDPATPYAAAGVLARTLGSGVLLSWDGQGHTAYLKSDCVTTDVNNYLFTTRPPTSDSCPAG